MGSNLEVFVPIRKGEPAVIGLPGNLISPAIFSQNLLKANTQIIPVSWGTSPGPWEIHEIGKRVIQLIKEHKLGPTVLAGHSVGGAIAMAAAIEAPHLINGLILSNTGANTLSHGNLNFPNDIRNNWGQLLFQQFINKCFYKPVERSFKMHLLTYAELFNQKAALSASVSLREKDFRPYLSEIKCPTLIAHGRFDKNRSINDAKTLSEGIRNAELVLLDAGHTPMVEDQRAWYYALQSLLDRVL